MWKTLLPRLLLLISILALQAECAAGNRKGKAGTAVRDAATICTPRPLCPSEHPQTPEGQATVYPVVDNQRCSEVPRASNSWNSSLVILAGVACSCPSRPSVMERKKQKTRGRQMGWRAGTCTRMQLALFWGGCISSSHPLFSTVPQDRELRTRRGNCEKTTCLGEFSEEHLIWSECSERGREWANGMDDGPNMVAGIGNLGHISGQGGGIRLQLARILTKSLQGCKIQIGQSVPTSVYRRTAGQRCIQRIR
jgi:hypothetical protein